MGLRRRPRSAPEAGLRVAAPRRFSLEFDRAARGSPTSWCAAPPWPSQSSPERTAPQTVASYPPRGVMIWLKASAERRRLPITD